MLNELTQLDQFVTRVMRLPEKITTPVTIPQQISLSQSATAAPINYRLHAIIYHHGKHALGGHYTAAVKSAQGWYHFDDDHQPIERPDEFIQTINGGIPYVLLYVQEDIDGLETLPINPQPFSLPNLRQALTQAIQIPSYEQTTRLLQYFNYDPCALNHEGISFIEVANKTLMQFEQIAAHTKCSVERIRTLGEIIMVFLNLEKSKKKKEAA